MNLPHNARLFLRGQGLLYVVVGCLFLQAGRSLAVRPGIFGVAPAPYVVPHACDLLECQHGYLTGPDGALYCSTYPPRQLHDARISTPAGQTRRLLGAACGGAGLVSAAATSVSGLLWFSGLWIPQKPARWCTTWCRAAPLIAVVFWGMACMLKTL